MDAGAAVAAGRGVLAGVSARLVGSPLAHPASITSVNTGTAETGVPEALRRRGDRQIARVEHSHESSACATAPRSWSSPLTACSSKPATSNLGH